MFTMRMLARETKVNFLNFDHDSLQQRVPPLLRQEQEELVTITINIRGRIK